MGVKSNERVSDAQKKEHYGRTSETKDLTAACLSGNG